MKLREILKWPVSGDFENSEQIQNCFDILATYILNSSRVYSGKHVYYLREIEFYFFHPEVHADPFVHRSHRQLEFAAWYFHRFKSPEGFIKMSRNGIDLTFGNTEKGIYGGILIRKIQDVETAEMIIGINRIAKRFIQTAGIENIPGLALGKGPMALDPTKALHMRDDEDLTKPIFKGVRNSLSTKNAKEDQYFFTAPYCYIYFPPKEPGFFSLIEI